MRRARSGIPVALAGCSLDLAALYERVGADERALIARVRGLWWFTEQEGQDDQEIRECLDARRRVPASLEDSRSP